MTTTKGLKLARFLKVVLDILFGMLIIAGVGVVLWMAFLGVMSGQEGQIGTASVPVILGAGEGPQSQVTFSAKPIDDISLAVVEEAEGTLRLETRSALLIVIANAAKLVVGAGLAFIVYLLRAVVKTILDGDPFAAENGKRLRWLGYTVLVTAILGPVVQHIAASEILNRLPATSPALSAGPTLDAGILLAALFVLLLAHIWSYGSELERDRELTV